MLGLSLPFSSGSFLVSFINMKLRDSKARFGASAAFVGILMCASVAHMGVAYAGVGDIRTVAQNGRPGDPTDAGFKIPYSVAVDAAGNIFVADLIYQRIRKIDIAGRVTSFAGTGIADFAGDGGPANQARLSSPNGMVFDGSGNLFIADKYNQRIRKVDTQGIITTVAGNGTMGFGGDGGLATEASLYNPLGMAVDSSGNLFIADSNNYRVRKVDPQGIITTVAGSGKGGFSGDGGPAISANLLSPTGVAVDFAGNLYIADEYNYRIRKVDTRGVMSTVAGNGTAAFAGDGGPAIAASLNNPFGICVDGAANLFIADASNDRVRKVDAQGIITTVAGNGTGDSMVDGTPATKAGVAYPTGVALDGLGNLFIADLGHLSIRRVEGVAALPTVPHLKKATDR